MRRSSMLVVLIMCGLIVGGCLNTGNSGNKMQGENEDTKDNENDKQNAYEQENYVPIQEYTGEGFTLRDANPKTGEIAEENREEVVTAVEDFFESKYKTEVNVHNIVSAVDGVSVFVESVGEPHFYSFAIVPIDIKNEEVKTDQVWSQEGQIENAVQGGLYAMAFENEFSKLDAYLEKTIENFPVVGTPTEIIEDVMGTGFTTTYYFTSPVADLFDELYEVYLNKPDITKEELSQFFSKHNFEPEDIIITINIYMEEVEDEPDEDVFNDIVANFEELEGVPRGSYSLLLHDNMIDKRRADGMKENTLKRTTPNKIIKE